MLSQPLRDNLDLAVEQLSRDPRAREVVRLVAAIEARLEEEAPVAVEELRTFTQRCCTVLYCTILYSLELS